MNNLHDKEIFKTQLKHFVENLESNIALENGDWTVKGFIDAFENVYSLSNDTKVISKILEIHIFPHLLKFAKINNWQIVLTDHQNYYPDLSFVSKTDPNLKFAVDFKTTYRNPKKPHLCNGFTLGSHGKYFEDRTSTKNIQFPYSSYQGHFCLGIIYDRLHLDSEEAIYPIQQLKSIPSTIGNFVFFVAEKWQIASDRGGSGNTANIGSIQNIDDLINGKGMFSLLGESWFDEYWINYNKIQIPDADNGFRRISSLKEYVQYKQGDTSLIVPRRTT